MKSIPTALADRIESGAATLAHVWLLTRADGTRLGFTDHDEDLLHDGVTCRAASGWTAGASVLRSGFAPGGASVSGALDSEALAAADLDAGLYDGCAVVCRRVDWRESTLAVLLWAGVITRVKREGDAFLAEIDGPLAALDRTAGRSFGRLCDANLGDDRCAVAAGHPAFAEGCDKRWRTCSDRFGNTMNFRGFPTIPGEDFLAVYPARGDRHDGKSRRG